MNGSRSYHQSWKKGKKYTYEHLLSNYTFVPIAVETFGSLGPTGLKFIKEIGTRIADATGEKRSTSFLFQSIGIAVQRGNAASIAGTIPSTKQLDELYYL